MSGDVALLLDWPRETVMAATDTSTDATAVDISFLVFILFYLEVLVAGFIGSVSGQRIRSRARSMTLCLASPPGLRARVRANRSRGPCGSRALQAPPHRFSRRFPTDAQRFDRGLHHPPASCRSPTRASDPLPDKDGPAISSADGPRQIGRASCRKECRSRRS